MTHLSTQNSVEFIDLPVYLLDSSPLEVVAYLKDAHQRYENEDIPKIEQQFVGLMKLFPHTPTLRVIFNLFQKFQMEMQYHMKLEEQVLYPQAISGELNLGEHAISHEDQEPFLVEIIHLLRKAKYAKNPFGSMLISSLENFERELRLHAWIEEHLLIA